MLNSYFQFPFTHSAVASVICFRWELPVVGQGQGQPVLELTDQVISSYYVKQWSLHISPSYPGLYVRVKNYLGWIKKHAASGACAKIVQAKITTKKKKKPRRKKKKKCGRKKKMKCRKKKGRTTTSYYYYLLELLELLKERGKVLRILW